MIQNGDILDGMYRIIQEIGRGGTGIIYLAEHLRLQKRVVVKKIKDHYAGQVNVRVEADILKRLHHSYLPQVFDFLVIGTDVYTVMEYVEGQDLQHYVSQGYRFTEKTVRRWMLQLCEVLDYLHTQNPPILHSDIKPSNIMITAQGNVCLIDFNISLDGEVSKDIQGVSPWFAAPEQYEKAMNVIHGKKDTIVLDARMDIYSLGAVFYYVMTGLLPSPDQGQCQDIFSMDLPHSEGMRAVVAKAMRTKAATRFPSARQMLKALQDVSRMDPRYRRYTVLQAVSVSVWLLCTVAGILLLYYGNWQNGIENFQRAYRQLYLSVAEQEDARIISQSTEMLNSYKYEAYLEQNEDKKAELLHVLGDSYFRQASFAEAAGYYKEAWELLPGEGSYYRDYIVALARDGQTQKARRLAESAEGMRGLSQGEALLIQAEICRMEEDYDGALAGLKKLEEQEADTEILYEGYLLWSSVYVNRGNYGAAVEVLEKAEEIKDSKEVRRRIGQAASAAAAEDSREAGRMAYLAKAFQCYQSLNQESRPSYEDRLNLALVERGMGKYEDSNDTLKVMERTYGEDYRIPMWMCYNYLDMAKLQGSYEGISEELKFCFQDCRHLYLAAGQSDADMEELVYIMKELEA